MARARVSQTGEPSDLTAPTSRAVGAVQSVLGMGGCDCEKYQNKMVHEATRAEEHAERRIRAAA